MLKNLRFPFVLLLLIFSGFSCLKNKGCSPRTPSSESAEMMAFATANGITPITHSSGLLYQVINPGSGPTASTSSTVYITYVGKLLDGTVFDQQANASATGWPLNQLIEGWRVGIPLIQKGGEIKLIVPSSMAYGCQKYGVIPSNAILYFDITLVNVI